MREKNHILIEKKDLDEALSRCDLPKLKLMFSDLNSNMVLEVLNEKERLLELIKRRNLGFIENVVKIIEEKIDEEKSSKTTTFYKLETNNKRFSIDLAKIATKSLLENQINPNIRNKSPDLLAFKKRIFYRIMGNNQYRVMDDKLFGDVISYTEKHNIFNETDFAYKISSLMVDENIKDVVSKVFKSNHFSHELKNEIIGLSFSNLLNSENLEYVKKNYSKNILEFFNKRLGDGLFWDDFHNADKGDANQVTYNTLSEQEVKKLIWLEENDLGCSKAEMPFYINYFRKMKLNDIVDFLNKIPTKEKYLEMFARDVSNYKKKFNPFRDEMITNHLNIDEDTDTENKKAIMYDALMTKIEYTKFQEDVPLFEKLSKISMNESLQKKLKDKEDTKVRTSKI